MKYSRKQWDDKLQEIMRMMEDDYPNDFELVVNSFSAEIRSTLQTMCFTNNKGATMPSDTFESMTRIFSKGDKNNENT